MGKIEEDESYKKYCQYRQNRWRYESTSVGIAVLVMGFIVLIAVGILPIKKLVCPVLIGLGVYFSRKEKQK